MSQSRLDLHEELKRLLGSGNVYYQPPESEKIKYPAIIYSLNDIDNTYANNNVYRQDRSYLITVIDKRPDNPVIDKLSVYPYCSYEREYKTENLHHTVFELFW